MAVYDALKTEGTTAIVNIATETKRATILPLPILIRASPPVLYVAVNSGATSIPARRWRKIKG